MYSTEKNVDFFSIYYNHHYHCGPDHTSLPEEEASARHYTPTRTSRYKFLEIEDLKTANEVLGKPLIGNLLEIPPQHSWLKFKEYVDAYGPIVRLNLAGQDHVILGTEKVANDLLRERGNYYSDRQQAPASAKLLTAGRLVLLLPYGEHWRKTRRFAHHVSMSSVAPTYAPEQHLEGIRLLRDIIRSPQDYEVLFERFSVGVAMRIIYGRRLESGHDYEARSILSIVHELERVASPGAYLVNLFPWMMWIPERLAPWKRYLRKKQRRDEAFFDTMVEETIETIAGGKGTQSWVRRWLESKDEWGGLRTAKRPICLGVSFEAAGGTTAAAMMSFVLAMTRHPHCFIKLQEELDSIVGPARLPTLDDMPRLPTVRAFVKETLRYYPVAAGGVPHVLTKDDIYENYFFKKGTLVHPVQWAILEIRSCIRTQRHSTLVDGWNPSIQLSRSL